MLSTTGTSLMTGGACSIAIFAAAFSLIIAAWASSKRPCISSNACCSFAISCPFASSRSTYYVKSNINKCKLKCKCYLLIPELRAHFDCSTSKVSNAKWVCKLLLLVLVEQVIENIPSNAFRDLVSIWL